MSHKHNIIIMYVDGSSFLKCEIQTVTKEVQHLLVFSLSTFFDLLFFILPPLSVYLYLFLSLSLCQSACLSLCLTSYLSPSQSVYLSDCVPLPPPRLCLCVCLSVYLPVCLSLSLSLSLSVSLSLSLSAPSTVTLFPHVCQSLSLSPPPPFPPSPIMPNIELQVEQVFQGHTRFDLSSPL